MVARRLVFLGCSRLQIRKKLYTVNAGVAKSKKSYFLPNERDSASTVSNGRHRGEKRLVGSVGHGWNLVSCVLGVSR